MLPFLTIVLFFLLNKSLLLFFKLMYLIIKHFYLRFLFCVFGKVFLKFPFVFVQFFFLSVVWSMIASTSCTLAMFILWSTSVWIWSSWNGSSFKVFILIDSSTCWNFAVWIKTSLMMEIISAHVCWWINASANCWGWYVKCFCALVSLTSF